MNILYTRNRCSACDSVKAYLNRNKIKYEEVNIEDDYDAAFELVEAGYRSVPVLKTEFIYLSGAENIKAGV